MITILENFLTGLERGGGGKSDYKDCFRSQKDKKIKLKIQYENVQNENLLFQISIRNLTGNERSSKPKISK